MGEERERRQAGNIDCSFRQVFDFKSMRARFTARDSPLIFFKLYFTLLFCRSSSFLLCILHIKTIPMNYRSRAVKEFNVSIAFQRCLN